jgi:hypothetical protein
MKARPPVTHKIDPDIDEARHALVEDLIFSQMLAKVGWVKGVGPARPTKPGTNLTGDPYFTDGYRTVLIIDQGPSLWIRSRHWIGIGPGLSIWDLKAMTGRASNGTVMRFQ